MLPSECIEMPHRCLPSSLCDEEISCFRTDTDGGLDEHPVHHVLWGCRPPGLRSLLQCSDVLEVPCSTLCGCKPLCGLGVVLSAVRGFHSCWWARLRTLFYHSKMQDTGFEKKLVMRYLLVNLKKVALFTLKLASQII